VTSKIAKGKVDTPDLVAARHEEDANPEDDGDGATADQQQRIELEHQLVQRCIAGEVAAWEELYNQHHQPLIRIVRVLLGDKGYDSNLVDELAAQVWYALIANDGKLLGRFDPGRGARLITFMRAIAKDTIQRHFRSKVRRLRRERIALEGTRAYHTDQAHFDVALHEFLDTLSYSEREFAEAYLLAEPAVDGSVTVVERSDASRWQLSRTIRLKLRKFLHLD
jgi:DNA-directed RNA polymerase specialized sigma24 family protein